MNAVLTNIAHNDTLCKINRIFHVTTDSHVTRPETNVDIIRMIRPPDATVCNRFAMIAKIGCTLSNGSRFTGHGYCGCKALLKKTR